jgi:hypothetical protein
MLPVSMVKKVADFLILVGNSERNKKYGVSMVYWNVSLEKPIKRLLDVKVLLVNCCSKALRVDLTPWRCVWALVRPALRRDRSLGTIV